MSNIIQTFPKGGSPTYAGLQDKPTVNDIDIEALSIEGMDVIEDTTNNVTEISAPGLNADSMADVTSGEVINYAITGGNTYSDGEQIIGRWLDGKPIYQKTFTSTFPSSINTIKDISISSLNIGTVINIMGMMKSGSGTSTSFRTIGSALGSGSQYIDGADVWINIASNLRFRTNVSSWCNNTVYITVQYTKTTDT